MLWFWRLWHILFHESPRGHRCRGVMTDKSDPIEATWRPEVTALRAKIARFTQIDDERCKIVDELRAENQRLRAALEKIEAGYSHQRLSAAELASIARQAL